MQASIAPVTLISGVGLLLLSMTNRYGRAIDRTRDLIKLLSTASDLGSSTFIKDHHVKKQILILYSRARVMRAGIACAIGCIFFTSLSIFSIFIHLSFGNNLGAVAQFAFVSALMLLIGGLGLYLIDMRLSLSALQLEIRAVDEDLV